ncbi:hypothetical protein Mpal_1347 [Methanosphaerula palustris E1-9c]|uniref:Uncharacterized protein n=1 Tax=Methanosphaerula palustris (strain ATCC BAA-1556 / DSM 19958 / E1-9c) TaxID=521011 RepID=B8GHS5_METPE|nr:hypothetical protein Mpal_1347 [Methanosphaerula palustris E1-9c]
MVAYRVLTHVDSPVQPVEGLGRPALVTSAPAGTLQISRFEIFRSVLTKT